MASIIKRAGYSDRFLREDKRFALAFPDAVQYLQSSELNELQSLQDDKLLRVASCILQDGRKMSGGDPVITAHEDNTKVNVRLPESSIYIAGLVHDVPEQSYALAANG